MPRIWLVVERAAPWAVQDGKLTRTGRFALIAILLIAGATAAFRLVMRLEIFDAGAPVAAAIMLGIGATILLGVGLMAAAFHSSRSGLDDEVSGRSDLDKSDDA